MDRYGVNNPMHMPGVSIAVTEARTKTWVAKYGTDNPMKNEAICAKALRNSSLKQNLLYTNFHWKTGEEIICRGSYENCVVSFLNKAQTDYKWQVKFDIPSGEIGPKSKVYICDLYLVKEDLYVEIKGYMRDIGRIKWEWFSKAFKNSELWDTQVLKEKGII